MVSANELSQFRQRVGRLLFEIRHLSRFRLKSDALIHGTPGEVFRTCGKKNCACMTDEKKRHGPYHVIQIVTKGKQRQVTLRKQDEESWKKSKQYQLEVQKMDELKKVCEQLQSVLWELLEKREEEFPKKP
jgi:hypothetical protein